MAYAWTDDDFPAPPTREQVEADLKDWNERLNGLLDLIQEWVSDRPEFEVIRSQTHASEPRMRAVGIDGTRPFPCLTLRRHDALGNPTGSMLHVTHDARWVGGTGGNVAIRNGVASYRVADFALHGPVEWVITPRRDPTGIVPFTKDEFLLILDEMR